MYLFFSFSFVEIWLTYEFEEYGIMIWLIYIMKRWPQKFHEHSSSHIDTTRKKGNPIPPPIPPLLHLPTFKQSKAHLPFQQIHPRGKIKAHNVEIVKHLDQTTLQWKRISHYDSAKKEEL